MLFLPAPFQSAPFRLPLFETSRGRSSSFPFADFRLTPHYPAKSPLDDVLLKVLPGADEYLTEKYAFEIMPLLNQWSVELRTAPPALASLTKFLDASIAAAALLPTREVARRSDNGIEVLQRRFARDVVPGRERFLREMENYLLPLSRVETAEFEIVGIKEIAGSASAFDIDIRYDLVGTRKDSGREQRVGHWLTRWSRS